MIELAPHHKRGLNLQGPVMPATGILGYSNAYRRLIPSVRMGALVTNPMTARPRPGAVPPRAARIPGGLLMHTGLDNPGVAAVIRKHRKHWERSRVPVIAHVAGVSVGEAVTCAQQLSEIGVVAALELGLPDSLSIEEAMQIIVATRRACALPFIVKLPLWRASDLAALIADLGDIDALTVAAPPRGTIQQGDRTITGRIYGPATFPQALWVVRQVAALLETRLPLIGCGGIHSAADAMAMLRAGASAVQVDSYIWQDPLGFAQLVQTVLTHHNDVPAGSVQA